MTAPSDMDKALNDYAYYWAQGDLTRASALLEPLLRRYPEDMELWWYRFCAQEKLGLAAEAWAEMVSVRSLQPEKKAGPASRPGEKGLQVIAELQRRASGPPTLFAMTVESASADLCRLFLQRLRGGRLPALCRRLMALDPAQAADILAEAQTRLAEAKAHWDEALLDLKAAFLDSPTEPRHLIRIACLLQAYEDAFEAWGQLAGLGGAAVPPGSAGARLAAFIDEAFKDIQTESLRRTTSDLDLYVLGLKIISSALRAGWSVQRTCREFFGFEPDDLAGRLSQPLPIKAALDFSTDLKMLSIARNIFYLSHQRPTPLKPADPVTQSPANRRFVARVGRKLQPLGYRFIGLFEQDSLTSIMNVRVTPGLFISPCGRTYVMALTVKPKWSGWLELVLGTVMGLLRNHKVMGTTSVLTNGRVLGIMGASVSNHFEQSPLFVTAKASARTSPDKLVQRHEEMLKQYQAENMGVGCRTFSTMDDVQAAMYYAAQVENEFRRDLPGYVSPVELRRMLGLNYETYSGKITGYIRKLDQVCQETPPDQYLGI